jgi:hypothetical protein
MLRLLPTLFLVGCGSLLAKPTEIHITAEPSGAAWRTSCGLTGMTPAKVTPVRQDRALVVFFELEGYRSTAGQIKSTQSAWV